MTVWFNALIVVLDVDIREDNAQPLIAAIKQMRGVLRVEPNVTSPTDFIAEQRARQGLAAKLWDFLHPQKPHTQGDAP